MNYALIENGVVTNRICLHPSNAADFPNAVPCGDYPVLIGDAYADGFFYRNGEKVQTMNESRQEEMNDMQEALALLGVRIDEQMA